MVVWGDVRKNIEVLQLIVSLKPPKDRKEFVKPSLKTKKTEITVSHNNLFVKYGGNAHRDHANERKPKPVCISFQGKMMQ